MEIRIEVADTLDDEIFDAFTRLRAQLSSAANPLEPDLARKVVESTANTVLLARMDGNIVGMMIVLLHSTISGIRCRFEDIVVDADVRKHGVGRMLGEEGIRLAKMAGARSIDFTSHPSRAGHNMYKSAGFEVRDTCTYRLAAHRM